MELRSFCRASLGLILLLMGNAWAQDAKEEFERQLAESRGLVAVGGMASATKEPTSTKAQKGREDALAVRYSIELTRGVEPVRMVPPESVFRSGDRIRLLVVPARDCHVYVVYHGADGSKTELLFPNQWNPSSRVAGGRQAVVPAQGAFYFDQTPGQERVSVLFSANPIPALEAQLLKPGSGAGLATPTPEPVLMASAWPGGRSRGLLVETRQEAGGAVNYAVDQDARSAEEPAVLKLVLEHQ